MLLQGEINLTRTQVVPPEIVTLDRLGESQDETLVIMQLYFILLKLYSIMKQFVSARLIITNLKYHQDPYIHTEQLRSLEEVPHLFFSFPHVEIIPGGLIRNTAFNFQYLRRYSTYKLSALDEIILAMRKWQEINFVS